MSAAPENERAVELLQRLLTDPLLRADFRRRPATTCRAFKLDDLADELDNGDRGTATIEQRESRSGMAGVMIAAAIEGVGLGELLARHAVAATEDGATATAQLIDSVVGAGDVVPADAGATSASGGSEPTPPAPAWAGEAAAPLPARGRPATAGSAPEQAGLVAPASEPVQGGLPPPAPMPTDGGLAIAASEPLDAAPRNTASALAPLTSPGSSAVAVAAVSSEPSGLPATTPAATGGSITDAAGLPPVVASPTASAPRAGSGSVVEHTDKQRPSTAAAPKQPPEAAAERSGIVQVRDRRRISADGFEMSGKASPRDYPGDSASKAEIADWMARRAAAAGVPPELPVMASLVESGLANLNHGDRDSVGFFQMRLGIWNRGDYRGYPNDAELQLTWFLDQATAVKSARIAAGDGDFGRDSSTWGNWIADVERPDERYRFRYQERLGDARELVRKRVGDAHVADRAGRLAASAPAGAVSAAALAENARAVDPDAAATTPGERAVTLAKQYLGRAYVWGGESPASGFDCSGLVQYVYGRLGIEIPRVTHDQFKVGRVIGRQELRTGDIVFFRDSTGYIHHEGLYLDKGRFLHAPRTGDVIKISSLEEPYYAEQFAGGRRVGEGAAIAQDVAMTRRDAGHVAARRVHDARVMPVIDPSAPRPTS